jgi:acyl-CoA thioesterase FadM
MICKNYIVSGEDVNDFMVMENTAYISYTLRLLYRFLFDKGFSKEKLKTLNLDLQEGNHELVVHKNLMFTEHFFIKMQQCYLDDKIHIKSFFFNSKNECCAEVTKEVEWFDNIRREVVASPKQILQHFNANIAI